MYIYIYIYIYIHIYIYICIYIHGSKTLSSWCRTLAERARLTRRRVRPRSVSLCLPPPPSLPLTHTHSQHSHVWHKVNQSDRSIRARWREDMGMLLSLAASAFRYVPILTDFRYVPKLTDLYKVDRFVPHTQHVNLCTVREQDGGRAREH